MKLLSKPEVKSRIQLNNDELLATNIRLRKVYSELLAKINNAKVLYSKDDRIKEYEQFCADILQKKSILLNSLKTLEDEIERKKEIIYGLIEKQDVLIEKEAEIKEREAKLDLRESFVKNIENKIYESRI